MIHPEFRRNSLPPWCRYAPGQTLTAANSARGGVSDCGHFCNEASAIAVIGAKADSAL